MNSDFFFSLLCVVLLACYLMLPILILFVKKTKLIKILIYTIIYLITMFLCVKFCPKYIYELVDLGFAENTAERIRDCMQLLVSFIPVLASIYIILLGNNTQQDK